MGSRLTSSSDNSLEYVDKMKLLIATVFGAIVAFTTAECQSSKTNPLANLQSPPDRVLFDRAQQFFRAKKYEQAITTLQVLFNTYPDSPYVARSQRLLNSCSHKRRCAAARKQFEACTSPGSICPKDSVAVIAPLH